MRKATNPGRGIKLAQQILGYIFIQHRTCLYVYKHRTTFIEHGTNLYFIQREINQKRCGWIFSLRSSPYFPISDENYGKYSSSQGHVLALSPLQTHQPSLYETVCSTRS